MSNQQHLSHRRRETINPRAILPSIPEVLHMYYRCSAPRNNRISRCGSIYPLCWCSKYVHIWIKGPGSTCAKGSDYAKSPPTERLELLGLSVTFCCHPIRRRVTRETASTEAHIAAVKGLRPYVGSTSGLQVMHGTGTARYRMQPRLCTDSKHTCDIFKKKKA